MAYTEYFAPTHVYFGKDSELLAGKVLKENGAKKVLLHYGSGSAEKSGLLGKIRKSLTENGIRFTELGGVQPNPRLSLARRGIEICRKEKIDFILAVGGGSAIDSAKCISYGVPYDGDVWDVYCGKAMPEKRLPVGVVLTLSATGSEMSNSSVITNDEIVPNDKFGCNTDLGRPVFALLNPELTYSVSRYQTGCGSTDIMMHTIERFFHTGAQLDLTDELAASELRTVIRYTKIALEKPDDYEARANIMWAGSVSHNGLMNMGFESGGDWACHRMEHELSALYDVAHGAGLSAIWSSWARYVKGTDPSRFAKLGKLVFGIEDKNPDKAADMTIDAFEKTFESFGMPVRISGLGIKATDETCRILADKASLKGAKTLGNFRVLRTEDMYQIYKAAK
ncbi:MAG: iron-containing alcohol dehydrogenase [Spirochaetales bacterium]|nr:iron-containing alcohol dehydrogenase [Spirochaetales bacterium]